jgi:hypothetical protein
MITTSSVAEQSIQVLAQHVVPETLVTQNIHPEYESLGLFGQDDELLDADSEIMPFKLPTKTHLAVGNSP